MTRMRFERVAALAMVALCMGAINASGADHDRHGGRNGQGRPGRRRSRRDGHAHQRGRGTRTAPAVTNDTGRLRFPERHGRHLHRRSDDGRVQDLRRPASRSAAATAWRSLRIDARSRRRDRNRERHGRSRRSSSRRAASDRSPSRPSRSRTCRSAHGNFTSLTQLTPGVSPEARRRDPPRRRRGPEQHHDGRRLGDGHRQQRPDARHEHRVDRRGQGPDPGLPGGVRPVERPADHRRHQERHQPLPRLASTTSCTNSDWNANRMGQRAERRPEADRRAEDARLLDRRPGRQAGRQQQAVLLLQPRVPPDDTTRSTAATRSVSACRPRSSAPATSRRRSTTTALFNFIKDPTLPAPAARRTRRLFPDGGVLGKIPPNRLYGLGLAILNRYPLPNRHADRRARNYNYEIGGAGSRFRSSSS